MKKTKSKQNLKNKKQNKLLEYTLLILGVWWVIAFLLAGLQAYLMSQIFLFVILGIVIAPLIFYLHYLIYKKIIQKKFYAKIILFVYALVNFIPLALQILNIQSPGIDNIIAALIGLLLLHNLFSCK